MSDNATSDFSKAATPPSATTPGQGEASGATGTMDGGTPLAPTGASVLGGSVSGGVGDTLPTGGDTAGGDNGTAPASLSAGSGAGTSEGASGAGSGETSGATPIVPSSANSAGAGATGAVGSVADLLDNDNGEQERVISQSGAPPL